MDNENPATLGELIDFLEKMDPETKFHRGIKNSMLASHHNKKPRSGPPIEEAVCFEECCPTTARKTLKTLNRALSKLYPIPLTIVIGKAEYTTMTRHSKCYLTFRQANYPRPSEPLTKNFFLDQLKKE